MSAQKKVNVIECRILNIQQEAKKMHFSLLKFVFSSLTKFLKNVSYLSINKFYCCNHAIFSI